MSVFLELQIKLLEKERVELREEIIKLKMDKEALTKQLTLTGVSHQRELLKAYTKWLDDKLRDSDELDELMDDYFRSL